MVFLFMGNLVSGAHLVGGEITYECVGGGNYLVRVRVYRDCASGGAAFDPTINIRAFDGVSGSLITTAFDVPLGAIQPVNLNSNDPCLTIPAGLCTEYADYEATMSLPPSATGYDITWQRCCRNSSISNLPTPGNWGNTYTIHVPPNDACGSSANFNSTPPIVICLNEPLAIDASATDLDGDSLYYEFCDILHGGSTSNPAPAASAPPYQVIPFLAPQTSSNPIPSSPQIKIDSATGLITGTASLQGQFVVGICVTSFKNGVPETTVRRDFQFNVSTCVRNVVSDMVTQIEDSSIYCSGRTIQFVNESQNGNSYFWDFGDTTSLTDTSYSANPVFTFPSLGWYDVTLITNPGTPCSDTVVESFHILNDPELEWGILAGSICFNVQDIYFGALSTNLPNAPKYEWYFGGNPPPNIPYYSGAFPPPITWPVPGKYPVTLVMKSSTCVDSIVDTIEIVRFNQVVDAGPDQIIAWDEDAIMNATGGVQYYWYADNPVYFSDQRDPQTKTRPIQDTTVYYVEVVTEDGCEGIDSLTLIRLPPNWPEPDYGNLQNVITPNGDGANDYLDLHQITDVHDVRFVLMNRWGSTVYTEEHYDAQWHGQDDGGDPLADGTYYYILQEGTEVIHGDAVTIIRNQD